MNQKYYDHRCDLWSMGVLTYVLLGGYPPFEGVMQDLAKEIQRGDFEFHDEYWCDISRPAKALIEGLLVVDPMGRMSAAQAMGCSWMEMADEQLIISDLSVAQASIRENVGNETNNVKTAVNTVRSAGFSGYSFVVGNSLTILSLATVDRCEKQVHVYCWNDSGGIQPGKFCRRHLHLSAGTVLKANGIFLVSCSLSALLGRKLRRRF
jgi:serine/threonine protein kinase